MFNVCQQCGLWSEEQAIDPAGPYALCPHCGHRHPFRRLPLFVITGPSGAGKSTVCLELAPRMTEYVCLESDTLWGHVRATPEENERDYWNVWLLMATAIGQSGRPVALFGTTLPDRLEPCPQRRYLATIHYLALVCEETALAQRLRARPAWRKCDEPFVADMLAFNRWLIDHAHTTSPPMTLLDVTNLTVTQLAERVAHWIREPNPSLYL